MYTIRSVLLAAALFCASPLLHATELIQNGNFEGADKSMWLLSGDSFYQLYALDTSGTPLSNPANNVFADGNYLSPGVIGQKINTLATATYTLSFDFQRYSLPNDPVQTVFQVKFNGVSLMLESDITSDWLHVVIPNLTAATGESLLEFYNLNASYYNQLDNISLFETRDGTPTDPTGPGTVPEPATLAILAAGLALMAGVRRRASRP
ncbi:PEP-CTERM sorting domain-containing protein [Pseudoduganella aquatica]|uniref:PEP-CTERM sorting domain-containing protein n=1 Tax=Pseudoduganella aquatica TaxID=2660641 RepID=UPI001E2B62D3|nr:PEP-CTERM sorting domain-containing protein [Pseudoduganella aquatica]